VRGVHAEHLADLAPHGGEHGVGRGLASDQRGHPPQRGLLLGEHAQLVATCLEHALRPAQLSLGAPALGHVPCDAVHDTPLRHRPRVPLEPPHRAVGAHDARLEPDHIMSLPELRQRLPRRLHVVRMSDVEDRPRKELRLRIPQRALERRVHALEVAVKPTMHSTSIERSKNSSSSVLDCGKCGSLSTSTRSFRSPRL
jgi:hypothetical protein